MDRDRCGPRRRGGRRMKKYENAVLPPTRRRPPADRRSRPRPSRAGHNLSMPLTIDALGTVTPFETVTKTTEIAGTLQHVGFTEGQTVKAGDFIAQIDPRPYEAALAQAQGHHVDVDAKGIEREEGSLFRVRGSLGLGLRSDADALEI